MSSCAWVSLLLTALLVDFARGNGVRASNVLGGSEQHASFSFVRPGLTQTAFAFNGPSSHQAFSSSIGDPHLAHRVFPNVANALNYRNPGLGYAQIASGPIASGYATAPAAPAPIAYQPQQVDYQQQFYQQQQQQALAAAYQQQLQQYQQYQQYQNQQPQAFSQPANRQIQSIDAAQQAIQLGRLFSARLSSPQAQATSIDTPNAEQIQQQQVQEQQEQQQTSNLLGVAYSAAPSVSHVRVNGNGYKFDF